MITLCLIKINFIHNLTDFKFAMEMSPKLNQSKRNLLQSVQKLKELIKSAGNAWMGNKPLKDDGSTVNKFDSDKCSLTMNKSCSSNFNSASTNLNESLLNLSFLDLCEESSQHSNHCNSCNSCNQCAQCTQCTQGNLEAEQIQHLKQLKHIQHLQQIGNTFESDKMMSCLKRKRRKKVKKLVWKRIEEIRLLELVEMHGEDWKLIASFFPDRSLVNIKEKYLAKLNPALKSSKFSTEEDEEILRLHMKYGNKWNVIAKHLSNRTSTMIKNRFYSCLKSRVKTLICETAENSGENVNLDYERINKNDKFLKTDEKNDDKFDFIPYKNVHDLNFNFDSISNNHREDASSNLFTDLDSSSLYNFNDGLCELSCYHTNTNSISSNNNNEYHYIFNKYENLQKILSTLETLDENSMNTNNCSIFLNKFDNINEISKEFKKVDILKTNLIFKIDSLRRTRDEKNMIPKENLLLIIDLMIELIKIMKRRIG